MFEPIEEDSTKTPHFQTSTCTSYSISKSCTMVLHSLQVCFQQLLFHSASMGWPSAGNTWHPVNITVLYFRTWTTYCTLRLCCKIMSCCISCEWNTLNAKFNHHIIYAVSSFLRCWNIRISAEIDWPALSSPPTVGEGTLRWSKPGLSL